MLLSSKRAAECGREVDHPSLRIRSTRSTFHISYVGLRISSEVCEPSVPGTCTEHRKMVYHCVHPFCYD
jgi:hypothetical protein